MTNTNEDYVLFITNTIHDTTFGVPVSIDELTTVINRLPLLDKRQGTYYDGITGVIEPYFDAIKPELFEKTITNENYA